MTKSAVQQGGTGKVRLSMQMAWFGIDFHVLYTLVSRAWLIVAGGVTILIVPHFLSKIEQGFYYTFASLLGLSVFFELGLNQVLIQAIGREVPYIEKTAAGYAGKTESLDRLTSIIQVASTWYSVAALLFCFVLSAGGYLFFDHKDQLPLAEWLPAWMLLSFSGAVNLYFGSQLAVMEGLGKVGNIARFRLLQSIVGYSTMWFALTVGAGLYSVTAVQLVSVLFYVAFMQQVFPDVGWFKKRIIGVVANKINWRRDILPFQWRVALSWISGYFIYQLLTPITFTRLGAVEAGKLGMALNIFTAITTVGVSWIVANLSRFAGHISRGDRKSLDSEHRSLFRKALFFTIFLALFVLLALAGLWFYDVHLIQRLPEPLTLMALALACVGNTIIISLATYMHAHGRDPLVFPSLICGALTIACVYAASAYSITAVSFAYLAVIWIFFIPMTILVFGRFKHK